MNLVLDIGNSYAKAGIFEAGKLLDIKPRIPKSDAVEMLQTRQYDAVLVSSVSDLPSALLEAVRQHKKYFLLNAALPLPFQNLYQTPHTLGTDRIAAVAGMMSLFPGEQSLAIDAGTCITYDLLDKEAGYYGGSISPGLQMRCKAMHTFTARLPLVEIQEESEPHIPLRGYNTHTALQSGALYGTVAEITQMIRMYEDKFGHLRVVICGGDAALLSKHLQAAHQHVPELILIGLNRILEHNVS
jgi:type III pantothenate kinase